MRSDDVTRHSSPRILRKIMTLLMVGALVYGLVQIFILTKRVNELAAQVASTSLALSMTTNQISKNFTDLSEQTVGLSNTLAQNIDAVKTQVGGVEQAVGSISGTVGNLQKLAQVDPVLLKKYSKVFFLNENYVPAHLMNVPSEYTYSSTRPETFLTEASPALKNLLDGARANGVSLYVKSGYRSFAEQKSLKSSYSVTYGAGTANAFSADQGYSEHQLGTAVDFITLGTGGKLDGFDKTQSYQWLLNNAYRFGFVLSYPKGNAYYVYEPWHWRYVGIKLATYLHDATINFYSLDQREIDAFLVNVFD